jgi:imidazolonepropionase-like amidohydrolase
MFHQTESDFWFIKRLKISRTLPSPSSRTGRKRFRSNPFLAVNGLTPLQAVHTATANGADYLEGSSRIGTLSLGKQADLVVIHGDPSSRISDVEEVEIVFKDGMGYDSAKLIASVRGLVGLR